MTHNRKIVEVELGVMLKAIELLTWSKEFMYQEALEDPVVDKVHDDIYRIIVILERQMDGDFGEPDP